MAAKESKKSGRERGSDVPGWARGKIPMSTNVLEEIYIWPYKFHLLNKVGYTLWGKLPDKDKDEVLLAVGETLLLFRTPQGLGEFIANGNTCNLSVTQGYQDFQRVLKKGDYDWSTFELDGVRDFNRIGELLSGRNWEKWSIKTCAKVLDTFNMLWDVAFTVKDDEIIDQMVAETLVGEFLDALTFMTKEELPTLKNFDAQAIIDFYNPALARVNKKILQIC